MPLNEDKSENPAEEVKAKVEKLNVDFYELEPTTYFLFRLRNLVLSAGCGLEEAGGRIFPPVGPHLAGAAIGLFIGQMALSLARTQPNPP